MFHEYPYQNNHELNLDWILNELNTFRQTFNSWADTIEHLEAGLEQLNVMQADIDALKSITSAIPEIQTRLDYLTNLHNADVEFLKSKIADLQTQINNLDVAALRTYIDSRDNAIMADYNAKFYETYEIVYSLFNGLADRIAYLADLVSKIDTMAYNPWPRTIEKISLQQNINYAYSDLADVVPTAEEYASLNLSADDYDDFDLLARDYSLFGRIKLKMHYVYSPVFGFKQEINNVLTSIVNYIKGTISADEYTALDLSAENYSTLDLTALEYYSFGTQSGLLALGGDGLTAEQYSTIQTI